jgi:hypothetical protein
MRLALDYLDQQRVPVPVIFPLASWRPAKQKLLQWATDRLVADYPELRASAARGRTFAGRPDR